VERYAPTIVAHRGIHQFYPENSLTAFLIARNKGVPWAECDVWPSADGAVVVIHDETLDRTTTGAGPVGRKRWEELLSLRLRDEDGKACEDSHLPSLHDVITTATERAIRGPMGMLVEIKPPDSAAFVRNVIDVVRRNCGPWMIQSFDEQNLIHALAHDMQTPVAFLVEDRPALERGIANGWKNINAEHQLLDESTVRRMRDAGVTVGTWTVNEEADLRRVMDLRVQWIITDEPVLARKLMEQR
jgi:glycerophosphoryl diester phosphodiesterase